MSCPPCRVSAAGRRSVRLVPLAGGSEGGGQGGEQRQRPGGTSQAALEGSHDSFTSSRGAARPGTGPESRARQGIEEGEPLGANPEYKTNTQNRVLAPSHSLRRIIPRRQR